MKDTRIHYPKDPIVWDLLPNVWATGGTMCGKRRAIDLISDHPASLTCAECVTNSLAYWTDQVNTCERLINYADSGQLKGTTADKESGELVPKLRVALCQARETVEALSKRFRGVGK